MSPRTVDGHARLFSKLKHFRRIAIRYDKLGANFSPSSGSPRCGCG
jgi:transposase